MDVVFVVVAAAVVVESLLSLLIHWNPLESFLLPHLKPLAPTSILVPRQSKET